jgi:hypothetical protein
MLGIIKAVGLVGMLAVASSESNCSNMQTADKQQNKQQEMLLAESNMQVGMPAITNFAEKRMAKMIFELRDNPKLTTISYIRDMNGKLHKVCDSIGYGLPYATQYTSPMRPAASFETHETGNIALPQADPNGLFSPPAADATWVICIDPKTKQISPLYEEQKLTVSQFELPLE